jgi:hypothetical protein
VTRFNPERARGALCRCANDPKRCLIDNGGPLGMIAAVKRATIRNLIRLERDRFLLKRSPF